MFTVLKQKVLSKELHFSKHLYYFKLCITFCMFLFCCVQGTFEMNSSDLVADLRAEVTFWCKQLEEKHKKEPQLAGEGTSQHSQLSPFSPQLHPPFRLISQGHELTPDLDEKSLAEVGFKDLQVLWKDWLKGILPVTQGKLIVEKLMEESSWYLKMMISWQAKFYACFVWLPSMYNPLEDRGRLFEAWLALTVG